MSADKVREYLAQIGAAGGASGKGKSKKRGDASYYARLARAAAKARAKNRKLREE